MTNNGAVDNSKWLTELEADWEDFCEYAKKLVFGKD